MKRREFVGAGLSSLAAFSLSGLLSTTPRPARAALINLSLVAEQINKPLVDGSSIPIWQYRDESGTAGPGRLTSGLVVRAGDTVTVTLRNTLSRSINFEIHGILSNTSPCAPSQTQSYTFTAQAAGSYYYFDGLNGELGRAMGLAGPLVVMPADGSNRLATSSPLFNRQYVLMLQELDTRLNQAVVAGQAYDMNNYEPNYFFVNGLSYPDTTQDASTSIQMASGELVAFRLINGGLIYNPLHFHGYHVQVVSRNHLAEQVVVDKDTVPVGPSETVEALLRVNQTGMYPLHSHFLPAVTANGVYANGALLLMNAV